MSTSAYNNGPSTEAGHPPWSGDSKATRQSVATTDDSRASPDVPDEVGLQVNTETKPLPFPFNKIMNSGFGRSTWKNRKQTPTMPRPIGRHKLTLLSRCHRHDRRVRRHVLVPLLRLRRHRSRRLRLLQRPDGHLRPDRQPLHLALLRPLPHGQRLHLLPRLRRPLQPRRNSPPPLQ